MKIDSNNNKDKVEQYQMRHERRTHQRKSIRIACSLEMMCGTSYHGHTRNISDNGVFMESCNVTVPTRNGSAPRVGDLGMLRLHYKRGEISESISARCRLIHITADGIGIFANFSELTEKELVVLDKILKANSDRI